MKNLIKFSLFSLLFSILTSCGEKKETDPNGNPVENKESAETPKENTLNPSVEKGKEIFEGKGTCATCHKTNEKLIGPSLSEISKIYKEKQGNIVTFLKGDSEAIVDPSQYEVMKANFTITKTMSDEELKGIEDYILSF